MLIDLSSIPDRQPDQDEQVLVLVLRRSDPANPNGDAVPDSPITADPNDPMAVTLVGLVNESGYDPAQSFVAVASVTDVEQGSSVSFADLAALQSGS